MSVVGTRPQLVKLAPVARAFGEARVEHVIVHTGQHYDPALSDAFFADLAIPAPDVHLGIGSDSHGAQTGAMLAALERTMLERPVDWVLVYGDTNSTIAAALAAVKLHLPLAHLEAGLRSFNRLMPEEHNRVLTDHAADLLLAPTQVAMGHLSDEGLAARAVLVGDVMTDVCFRVRDAVLASAPARAPFGGGRYVLATIHRADNTDDPARLAAVIDALAALPLPVVLAAHPRLRARCAQHGIDLERGALTIVEPLPYSEMVAAVLGSAGVVTDSGGLQKEAYLLERPCTTLRTETEWVETLEGGWNVLRPGLDGLAEVVARDTDGAPRGWFYGRGDAADRVVDALTAAPAPGSEPGRA